jgi:hypothetical protein
MSWEALTAISTAFTGVVILLTVIYASRQVRVATEQARATVAQLEHLRKSNQLEGLHQIFDQLLAHEFTEAYSFVLTELPHRLKDEKYHTEAITRGASRLAHHKEFVVFRTLESVGTWVKFGMIEGTPLYDFAGPTIVESWQCLERLVGEQRAAWKSDDFWENFEYLARNAERYLETRRRGERDGA